MLVEIYDNEISIFGQMIDLIRRSFRADTIRADLTEIRKTRYLSFSIKHNAVTNVQLICQIIDEYSGHIILCIVLQPQFTFKYFFTILPIFQRFDYF